MEKSERANPDVRARIYQSARQALDAGLKKQGVSDPQVVLAQHQRLEEKIREIEMEERQAEVSAQPVPPASRPPVVSPVVPPVAPPVVTVAPVAAPAAAPSVAPPIATDASRQPPGYRVSEPRDASILGGATRDAGRPSPGAPQVAAASGLDSLRAARAGQIGRASCRERV